MQVGFQEVLNFIGKANQEVLDYVHATHGGRKLLLEGTDKDLELDFDSEIVQAIAAHSNSGLQEMKEELQEMKEELQEMKEELQDRFDAKFDELNAKFDAGTMDLMIQVVKKQDPTTLMIVTTFRGMPVQADIEIVGFDEGTEEDVSISFESKQLGNGKVLLKLKESSAKFLTIKALYRGVDNHSKDQQGGLVLESSELVSILGW